MVTVTSKKYHTIADLANEAHKRHKNIDDGVEWMHKNMGNSMKDELITNGLRAALHDARHRVKTSLREQALANAKPSKRTSASQAIRSAIRGLSIHDEWTMPDGSPLGDCTKDDLLGAAATEEDIGNGHLSTAEFYRKLARKLSGNTIVRNKITAMKVEEILAACS